MICTLNLGPLKKTLGNKACDTLLIIRKSFDVVIDTGVLLANALYLYLA